MYLEFWGKTADFLWSGPLAAALFALGIISTIRFGVPQSKIPQAVRDSLRPNSGEKQHPFTALMLHLAATLGVGNIVGVAAAIIVGGRGAVVWCWFSGVLGIATAYAETRCALEVCTEAVSPMHVLKAYGKTTTANIYAFFLAVSGLFAGAMLPANAVSSSIPLPAPMGGVILTILTALVIFGGISSITRVCEKLVPAVMILFLLGCLGILWINRGVLAQTLVEMFKEAFSFRAATGGIFGSAAVRAMRIGIARGVFSNEAGMGTAAITIGTLRAGDTHSRSMVSAAAVFWDTVVFCGLTGFSFAAAATADPRLLSAADGTAFSMEAFSALPMGRAMLSICMAVLGFCCIIGWCYVGGRGFTYLCPGSNRLYCVFWCAGIFLGTLLCSDVLWIFSDLVNVFVIVPSLEAILFYMRRKPSHQSRNSRFIRFD